MQVFHNGAVDGDLYFASVQNPTFPPPQPINVVVGLYIDRCIMAVDLRKCCSEDDLPTAL